eukprot:TRINITY_DN2717_c2_g1_i2.p1 TRINITY_DN2717_c2_g1~~TRINITY_DN2717_c2_g1_i2.p1  ORF type:complete len:282 (-),score=72.00 TRINITY_DN2717_c2_g1_i2:141-986(-)
MLANSYKSNSNNNNNRTNNNNNNNNNLVKFNKVEHAPKQIETLKTTIIVQGPPKTNFCVSCPNKLHNRTFGYNGRFCWYTGKYYCKKHHDKQSTLIPFKILHEWDFTPLPVSKFAYNHIKVNFANPILDINKINPKLYDIVPSLRTVRHIRKTLMLMSEFIYSCRSEQQLLNIFGDKNKYFLESLHIFSLRDLTRHQEKRLIPYLESCTKKIFEHITKNCQSCRGKGFFCDICNNNQLIFTFEYRKVTRCPNCNTLVHRECLKYNDCVKCERIKRIKQLSS